MGLLMLFMVVFWYPMGQAQIVQGTGDKFLNEGYIISSDAVKGLPQYLEYRLMNFHTKRNETYLELGFKTEYWDLKNPSFSNEKYFTGIALQFDNKVAFNLPPSQPQVSQGVRMKTGAYVGECVVQITSDNKRMAELISYIKGSEAVKVRVSYNDGTQAIFDLPSEILTEWKTQVIPYSGVL